MAKILDGRKIRDEKAGDLARAFAELGREVILAIIQVGENKESGAYIEQKIKFGEKLGVNTKFISLPEIATEEECLEVIERLNSDNEVCGIILQLPIPAHLNETTLVNAILPEKDVDGLTESNLGKIMKGGRGAILPATARGVISLLSESQIEIAGQNILVIGRSVLVGKPLSLALLARDATVTVAHSKTRNLAELARSADIIISAVGSAGLINKDFVKEGQVVIDVGITAVEENGKRKIVGDVAFPEVSAVVDAISPVPGGVGPMTVLSLFENLYDLAGLP